MPGRNRTGPMSGRGFGNCMRQGQGGNGRGMGRMSQAGTTQEAGCTGLNAPHRDSDMAMENQELIRQNEALQSELDAIKKRLDEMESRTGNASSNRTIRK